VLQQDVIKSDSYQHIQQMISKYPVMVFSKTTCNFSAMAKNVLNEVGVNYEVEEIDRRDDTDKLQEIFAKITTARTVSCSMMRVIWTFCLDTACESVLPETTDIVLE